MWYKIAMSSKNGVYTADLNLPINPTLRAILAEFQNHGHKALVVGGAVRDAVMGVVPKDIDIEVYGVDYDELYKTLSKYGRADIVGKSFGVVKLRTPDGQDYDFSVPRRDSKTGDGHTGFEITFDQDMTPQEAAARRDFTMNALAYDPLSSEIHDYYGGMNDLRNGLLRATTEAFKEDPLRVLRGMQFAARYGLRLDEDTAKMCQEIVDSHDELATERIAEEWMKLAIKGKHPGTALQYLADTGWLKHYPELESMFNTIQDPVWHPEGWEHKPVLEDKGMIYQSRDDSNVTHWQDVVGYTGNAPDGSRYVSRPNVDSEFYLKPHIYVTVDVPIDSYHRYVFEQDRVSASPIINLAVKHLEQQYDVQGKKRHRSDSAFFGPDVYTHAEKKGDSVELTVGLNSELSEELVRRGCPEHVYVKMGDVATHTAHVMDAAAEIAERDGIQGDDRATLVLAAMVHDIAKPQTTEIQHHKGHRRMAVTSRGHEAAGEPKAMELLSRMGIKRSIRDKVGPLVKHHLAHITIDPEKSSIRKFAKNLAPATIEELARLIESDHSGRPPLKKEMPEQASRMLEVARDENVADSKPMPIIQGKHVLPYHNGASGKHIGVAVSDAYEAYLGGAYDGLQDGLQWLNGYMRPRVSLIRGEDIITMGIKPGPVFRQILSDAWNAQQAGFFLNRESAMSWLSNYVAGMQNQPNPQLPESTDNNE